MALKFVVLSTLMAVVCSSYCPLPYYNGLDSASAAAAAAAAATGTGY
ncbi:unnamed protein product, partial [Timema podura]|nr:unnamed protein product [Timema podura]